MSKINRLRIKIVFLRGGCDISRYMCYNALMITLQTKFWFRFSFLEWVTPYIKPPNCNFCYLNYKETLLDCTSSKVRYCFSLHEDCRYKNSDHNNKSIKNISCMVTISCKSIYVSEIFGGLLTTDSIFTVSYSAENYTNKTFLKLMEIL